MTERTKNPPAGQKRSLGGHVIEAGLTAAGYDWAAGEDIALVETARPRRRRYGVVLAQNAWNVADASTFWFLLRQYPLRRRARYVMRRVIAGINLRRARKVVCLTEAMSALCGQYSSNVVTSPVTVPFDFLAQPLPSVDPDWSGTALVPGTITWHKNPVEAVRVVQELQHNGHAVTRIVFAGTDDGSGCWQEVESAAKAAGISCSGRQLSREEMSVACASAATVIIPSQLESLSLSMAEALTTGSTVIASDIPAHRELADRLGRQPLWLGGKAGLELTNDWEPPKSRTNDFRREWKELGECLGLPTMAETSREY